MKKMMEKRNIATSPCDAGRYIIIFFLPRIQLDRSTPQGPLTTDN